MYQATVPSNHTASSFTMSQPMRFTCTFTSFHSVHGRMSQAASFSSPRSALSQCPKHPITMSQGCDFAADHNIPRAKQHGYCLNDPPDEPRTSPVLPKCLHLECPSNVLVAGTFFSIFHYVPGWHIQNKLNNFSECSSGCPGGGQARHIATVYQPEI